MSEYQRAGKARIVSVDKPTVEISVPAGTSLDKVFNHSDLVNVVRGIGPRGCETCISGREFLVNIYEEVTLVELGE